ncbi:MAG TPA: succinate dehydrogenase, cytochrome b556 subunit [Gammaproteobacteria bacterium]|nr:succinate dehydrogenase, cytochrome b556 subunit [Gammaproteobacteria bacterium]
MISETRPTSPHIGIYRWRITMTLSILHRASGIVLYSGAIGLVYWLVSLALGPRIFAMASWFFHFWVGQALLCLWSLAFFYHLLNGVRHLVWDTGRGFDKPIHRERGALVYRVSGWVVVVSALILTAAAWAFGWLLSAGVL